MAISLNVRLRCPATRAAFSASHFRLPRRSVVSCSSWTRRAVVALAMRTETVNRSPSVTLSGATTTGFAGRLAAGSVGATAVAGWGARPAIRRVASRQPAARRIDIWSSFSGRGGVGDGTLPRRSASAHRNSRRRCAIDVRANPGGPIDDRSVLARSRLPGSPRCAPTPVGGAGASAAAGGREPCQTPPSPYAEQTSIAPPEDGSGC